MSVVWKKLIVVTGLLVGLSSVTFANGNGRELYTPALQKASTEAFTCRVVNTGKQETAIDIVILGGKGTPLESQKSVVLLPGATTSDTSTTKNTIAYCKVTVKNSPNTILVTLCTQPFSNGPCHAVVTAQ